jgi:hypothetical protein
MEEVLMVKYQITKRDYSHWVNVTPIIDNMVSFKFQTEWTGAKNPKLQQNKFEMNLSVEEIDRMIEVLTAAKKGIQ